MCRFRVDGCVWLAVTLKRVCSICSWNLQISPFGESDLNRSVSSRRICIVPGGFEFMEWRGGGFLAGMFAGSVFSTSCDDLFCIDNYSIIIRSKRLEVTPR